jgi:hypothetical protein
MDNLDSADFRELLTAVGEHLAADGQSAAIVVVGGSALAMMGWVDRTTKDVDVIAQAGGSAEARPRPLLPPEPLPDALVEAIGRVARDYGLPSDWMNTAAGMQWLTGLPDDFVEGLEWRRFGALDVGFAGRASLIALKLFAAVDQGSESVHFQDLVGLEPADGELDVAADWVARQDPAGHFGALVAEEVENVRSALGRD